MSDPVVTFRLPRRTAQALREIAKSRGETFATFVRRSLAMRLDFETMTKGAPCAAPAAEEKEPA